jgi:hypothetical protein
VEIHAGALYMQPELRPFGTLVLNSNGTQGEFHSAGVLPGGGSLLAAAFPIGRERPLTLGAAVFLPFSTMIRVSGSPVNYPFYPLYNDISRNFFFVVGAGMEVIDGWGLGVNVRSTTKSVASYTLRADNSVNYSASAVEAKGESRLSFSLVYDNVRSGGKTPYSAGAMYRAKSGLETKLVADVTAFVPVQGELVSLPAYTPSEWVLMGSWRLGERLTIAGDFSWVKWSEYVSPYGSGNINSYVIGSARQEAGFRDIATYRFGADYGVERPGRNLRKLSYRLGYAYFPSPVPDQSGDTNFVDCDRHSVTAGFGVGIAHPWRDSDTIDFDLFAQYHALNDREVRKAGATNVGAPGYRAGGKIWLYGAGANLKF